MKRVTDSKVGISKGLPTLTSGRNTHMPVRAAFCCRTSLELNTHNAFRTCRIWRAGFFFGAGWKRQTWKFNSENVELKVRGFVNFTCFAMTKDNKTTFVFVNRFFVYLGFVSNLHQFKLITFWKSRRTQNFGRDWKKRLFTKLCFSYGLCYWNKNGFVNIYWQKQNFKSRN